MNAPGLRSHISRLKSKNYAIIVGGGSGSRMQTVIPKQFLLLKGKPVLMHTIEAFHYSDRSPELIVVLPAEHRAYWVQLCREHNFIVPHQVVNGGETRFQSVKNGLDAITDEPGSLIAVHDAVRPLTGKEIIDRSYDHAEKYGNAIAAVKSRDSVRQQKGDTSISLIRDDIFLIQTPQTFLSSQLKKAYLQPYSNEFTDDASVVEKTGVVINLIDGSYQNIKITFPEDIKTAELWMEKNS